MEEIKEFINESGALGVALIIVAGLIIIATIVSLVVSIFLAINYHRYNKRHNSIGKTGKEIAREILDNNGLSHIKVKCVGSIMFGNSYSHYFKKVRLRRMTWKKKSLTSLAMASEKASLAVLDKENDPDMKRRIRLVPLITFGPFMFIPLVLIGVLIDIIVFNFTGVSTIIAIGLGLLFYVLSFVLSLSVLKTEKKAQKRALELMKEENLATNDELEDIKYLYHLYNIEYVNNIILELLELIYRILQIVLQLKGGSSSSSSNSN